MVDPLVGDADSLGSDYAPSMLVHSLLPDVQHHLLHKLWSQRDQDPKKEVALYLLLILEAPLVGHVLAKPWQLLSLRPETSYA